MKPNWRKHNTQVINGKNTGQQVLYSFNSFSFKSEKILILFSQFLTIRVLTETRSQQ